MRKLMHWAAQLVRKMMERRFTAQRVKGEYRNIERKKALCEKVTLTAEQQEQIDSFFEENYGRKVPYHWHRLYQSYTGTFRKDYFPEILFSTQLAPFLNDRATAFFLGDKNLLEVFFGNVTDIHIPKTFASCIRGICQDDQKNICSIEILTQALADVGLCVIKKTVETDSGRDVMLCNFENGVDLNSGRRINEIFPLFGSNFVVQELVQQSDALKTLNSTSVNTFRVISYICEEKIYTCPVALRLGRNGADKDNIHYGGICIGVTGDGALRRQAFSEYGENYTEHPDSKVVFEGYKIPGAESLEEVAKKLHACIPWLKVISWDLTLDCNNKATLIEMNTLGQAAWFPQMVNGEPLFGENTAKMLNLIKK